MATTASAAPPQPLIRRELAGPTYFYELTQVGNNGLTMHVSEDVHDVAVFLTPQQIVEMRADLAMALLRITPPVAAPNVRSEAGRHVAELVRRAFMALVELDKVSGAEVDELYRAVVAHVRSARPYVLREVGQ